MRVFRLDRMKDVHIVEGEQGEFTVPKGFKIASYLNRAPWELSDEKPVTARVRINFPQSRWVIGERLGKVVKAVTDDAGSEFEFEVRAVDAFVRWLLPLGKQVEVLSPTVDQETARRSSRGTGLCTRTRTTPTHLDVRHRRHPGPSTHRADRVAVTERQRGGHDDFV